MRSRIALTFLTAVLCYPSMGLAQEEPGDDECPPGGWFCDEEGGTLEGDEAGTDEAAEPGGAPDQQSGPDQTSNPPVVVYTPEGEPPPKVVVVQPTTEAPPPAKKRRRRRFGINLRLEGVAMGEGEHRHRDAAMGGAGVSFRYRPVPHFALDVGLDSLGGTDFSGNRRHETALSVSGIVFFNPRNPVQFYMLGGFSGSGANVEIEDEFGDVEQRDYSYFGAQLGAGLEFRVSRLVSLNVDLVGFMRGRTDSDARNEPEFTDPDTGRTTNTSGGGLLRGGITFYW